jgi:hypothetical protein
MKSSLLLFILFNFLVLTYKLAVLKSAGLAVGADLSKTPLIICDCGDSSSLIGQKASKLHLFYSVDASEYLTYMKY